MKAENKRQFIEELGALIMLYSRERISRIVCAEDDSTALIYWCGGNVSEVNITADSCVAAMFDIAKHILDA